MMQQNMLKPKILRSKTIYSGYLDVRQDLLERLDGKQREYTHFILPTDAAVILAETKDGKFVLNREYRHPIGDYLLGCPGGRLEPGEDPLVGALREFEEETGYSSLEMEHLGLSYPFPGLCNQRIHFVRAKNAYPKAAQSLDAFEYIHIELKTEQELRAEIAAGGRVDGLLITALGYRSLR